MTENSNYVDKFTAQESQGYWEAPKGVQRFSFAELVRATSGFNSDHEIGVGGFGKVFYGQLDNGKEFAIKRSSSAGMQGGTEFRNEVMLLSRLHHRNLVRLEGFCEDNDLQILVYEYVPDGNLHRHLLCMMSTAVLMCMASVLCCWNSSLARRQLIPIEQKITILWNGWQSILSKCFQVKIRMTIDGLEGIIDPRIRDDCPLPIYQTVAQLAISCASFNKKDRPQMKEAVAILDNCLRIACMALVTFTTEHSFEYCAIAIQMLEDEETDTREENTFSSTLSVSKSAFKGASLMPR